MFLRALRCPCCLLSILRPWAGWRAVVVGFPLADFFALRNQYRGRLDFADAKAMYHAYEKELYQFDQLYRHFCETADLAEAEGWGYNGGE